MRQGMCVPSVRGDLNWQGRENEVTMYVSEKYPWMWFQCRKLQCVQAGLEKRRGLPVERQCKLKNVISSCNIKEVHCLIEAEMMCLAFNKQCLPG